MEPRLRRILFGALPWLAAAASLAQAPSPESARIDRLVSLGKLWGSVKFSHPFLAYRDLDWDAALVQAIPRVNAAKTSEEFAAAIQGMLDALNDPATHVVVKAPSAPPTKEPRDPSWNWTEDRVLVVTVRNYADLEDYRGAADKLREIGKEIVKARAVLFDLRSVRPVTWDESGTLPYIFARSGIQNVLSSEALFTPGQRLRLHVGFAPEEGETSGDYYSAFSILDGRRLSGDPSVGERPVAFLINEWSELPPIALALQAAGKGFIVGEGKASDASVIRTRRLRLSDDVEVRVRLSELLYADGSSGLRLDADVPRNGGNGDRARDVALDLLRRPKPIAVAREPLPARAVPTPERAYRDMTFPPVEYRLLAAFRIWSVVEYFFPYKDLMGEDWNAVLKEFIPRMEEARDARDYALAVAEMVTHVHDSHVFVSGNVLSEFFGVASPPVLLQMIEGVPIVVGFLDRDAARGVAIGDEIVSVDGEDVRTRFERHAKYTSSSTPQGLNAAVMGRFLNGSEGSRVKLTVRNAANREKSIDLPRKADFRKAFDGWRSGEVFRILPGNIGYADLERLTVPMVDAMFEAFRETKAIVFDMRGYPRGTAWSIAPRLTERTAAPAARFDCAVLLNPEDEGGGRGAPATTSFVQRLPATSQWRYKGKTVMLIDERAVSQSEHSGLFFEAANGTTFIGSPTTGANGDVTNFLVPGGIRISFTGQSVRHADGRQLQRIGLVPHVAVRPTIGGIRTGRDEVLEKAIEFIQNSASGSAGLAMNFRDANSGR